MNLKKELEVAKRAAFAAGKKILEVYNSEDFQVRFKDEKEEAPVALADRLSNIELCRILHTEFPEYGILSEEVLEENVLEELPSLKDALENWRGREFSWIIDPLDGTKYFVKKSGKFGVQIGLVHKGKPVLGVNYYPVEKLLYFATKGKGTFLQKEGETLKKLSTSSRANFQELIIVSSKKIPENLENLIKNENLPEPLRVDGAGLKICKIAEGEGDLYILIKQTSPTGVSIWDICSCASILEEAGGKITDLYGEPINFFQEHPELRRGAIASNGRISHKEISKFIEKYIF